MKANVSLWSADLLAVGEAVDLIADHVERGICPTARCRRRDSNPRHADYDSAALTD
jgi:hypothetical protein